MNSTNEIVLRVLKTKAEDLQRGKVSDKKMSAYLFVESDGLEVLVDAKDSVQGYVSVRNPETGRTLVISKDYSDKTRVYGNHRCLGNIDKPFKEVVKDIDFCGYLNKPTREKYREERSKAQKYNIINNEKKRNMNLLEQYERQAEQAMKNVEKYKERIEEDNKKINELKK